MNDIKQIRFVATNFYNLQGLRAVPLGVCLLLLSFWANGLQGPARDFLVPVSVLIVSLVFLFAIDRYYLQNFGRVQRTPESRHLESLFSIVGGILALGALWLDISFELPVNLLGLVFAVGLLADYIRLTWLVKGHYLLYYPLGGKPDGRIEHFTVSWRFKLVGSIWSKKPAAWCFGGNWYLYDFRRYLGTCFLGAHSAIANGEK